MPNPAPENILSAEAFAEAQKKPGAPKIARRKNTSLNRGGSVDLCTTADGQAFAVVRYAEITPEVIREIAPLLEKAQAKATQPPLGGQMPEGVSPVAPAPATPTPTQQPQ